MNRNRLPEILRKPVFLFAALLFAVLVTGGFRIMYYIESPDVLLLVNHAGAQWIKHDSEFELETRPAGRTECRFKYVFSVNKKIDAAEITVQALKKCRVLFDGVDVFSSNGEFVQWKQVHNIKIPFAVPAGHHEIIILVTGENSPPAVIAYSNTMPVKTGPGWFSSDDGENWQTAVPASRIKQPAISEKFPSSAKALVAILPCLSVVFVVAFLIAFFTIKQEDESLTLFRRNIEPAHVRWLLLFSWALLALNNLFKLNFQVGNDIWGHIEYIDYIATRGSLPLASQGWQMYQAPLNYILNAPLYALLLKGFDLPSVVKIMTIFPVICGLIQIEIVYRTSRLAFQERKDLQIFSVIAGSLLPVHTYICQFVGNEPLAACFISIVIFLCMSLVMNSPEERRTGYFIFTGIIWGLSLLSKMTALLLAPVLLVVVAFYAKPAQKAPKFLMILFGVATLIAGWYYFRNYIEFGTPFAGTFEHSRMLQWWQDPGYRTWSQFLSFGRSLCYPVYAGTAGFWAMFYSTLWLDGFNSGLVDFIPWNENFMIAGALLALLPAMFILIGVLSILRQRKAAYGNAVILSLSTILLFLAAMLDIFMIRPVYSIKASYTLGLLPCYAILVAAGMEPFLRNKLVRCMTIALFSCWAFAAYAAYFVVKLQ